MGLFNNITTGMKDLIDKPKEGFTKGPLEGGYGIVKGAGSLVGHTIAGAFNSINKITGSVSSGLSNLTTGLTRSSLTLGSPTRLIRICGHSQVV